MRLWVIGGLDPTGGAGVLRDRWTAELLVPGIDVVSVITAHTEQGDGRPARSHPVEPRELADALRGLADADAIKIGLVPVVAVRVVLDALAALRVPRVLDPVLTASDGGRLGSSADSLRLLARAVTLVTPNRAEASALGDDPGVAAVLRKDAEPDERTVCDRLHTGGVVHRFVRPRGSGVDPRGTGCALATAIACALGEGDALPIACARAIAWLDRARLHTELGPDGRPHLPRTGVGFA